MDGVGSDHDNHQGDDDDDDGPFGDIAVAHHYRKLNKLPCDIPHRWSALRHRLCLLTSPARPAAQLVKYGINVNLVLIVAQGLYLCVKDQRNRFGESTAEQPVPISLLLGAVFQLHDNDQNTIHGHNKMGEWKWDESAETMNYSGIYVCLAFTYVDNADIPVIDRSSADDDHPLLRCLIDHHHRLIDRRKLRSNKVTFFNGICEW